MQKQRITRVFYFIALIIIFNSSSFYSQTNDDKVYNPSLLLDGSIIGLGIINGIAASSFPEIKPLTIDEINRLNKNDVFFADRWSAGNFSQSISNVSDVLVVSMSFAPMALLFDKGIRNEYNTFLMMYAENILWSAFTPSYAKETVQRVRPYAYSADAPIEKKQDVDTKRSFFSGHSCMAFSSAVFLSKVYTDFYPDSKYIPYVWSGSLLMAGTIAYLRIQSGAHYLTDVLVGSAVGGSIGYLIPSLHKNNSKNKDLSLQINPYFVSLTYRF